MKSIFEQQGGTYTMQAITACQICSHPPKKNAPSAYGGSVG